MVRIAVLFSAISIVNLTAFSQVSTRTNIVEQGIYKPISYDSLENLKWQYYPVDFYKYIGQSIYFPQVSQKFLVERGESVTNTDTAIYGLCLYSSVPNSPIKRYAAYYAGISSLSGDTIYANSSKQVRGCYFKIIDVIPISSKSKTHDLRYLDDVEAVSFILVKNGTMDTLFFDFYPDGKEGYGESYVLGFYEKIRKAALKRKFVWYPPKDYHFFYDKDVRKGDFVEINTGELLLLQKGSVWTCTEVSFIETRESLFMEPHYILKDKTGKEIKISIEEINNQPFIDYQKYQLEALNERKKSGEYQELLKKLKKQETIGQQTKATELKKYRLRLVQRFGEKMAAIIISGKVQIGMSKEMCKLAWGPPIDINKTTNSSGTSEQWVYSMKYYLYFNNGILTAIQN